MSYKYPMEITTGKADVLCITFNGRNIYRETTGINNPVNRGVIIHGFGRSEYEERFLDIGSRGCVHTTSEGMIAVAERINEGDPVYIFIAGAETDFSDLPEYEKEMFQEVMTGRESI